MKSSREIPACSKIARSVPLGMDFRLGIMTSLIPPPECFTMAVWLPFPLFGASSKPAALSAEITCFDDRMGSFVIAWLLLNGLYTSL